MSFFISDALAQAAPAASQQLGMEGMIFPLGILVFFYFFFIRPQAKRGKEQKQMLNALNKGAEVVTTGGILGKVVELDDNFVKLEVSENTFLQVQRHQVANMMPKGTYKALSIKKPTKI
ncbi:MAG: preprotein translocase subunit YajC [Methylococcales bacterium]|nr:preprotein translocase subunit YajC [Methylococcales bacterium]